MLKDAHFHRRNLPHIYIPEATYFITYRLKGSLPASKIFELRSRVDSKSAPGTRPEKYRRDKTFFKEYDQILNKYTYGKQYLKIPEIANITKESMHHYDGKDYNLIAYTVMPNHVHLVYTLLENSRSVNKIMQSIKRYSARESNLVLKREGSFWQSESYDHIVRDEDELYRIINYTIMNPVKAGFVDEWEKWPHTYLKLE